MSMGYVFVYLFLVLSAVWGGSDSAHAHDSASADGGRHNNNWAVILSSSKYWFNYRHNTNALSIYRTVRELGIPDSQILLLLADDASCNSRNILPGTQFFDLAHSSNVYGEHVQVDYRGCDVTVENFFRLLTGRHHAATPRAKRLLTNAHSNVLVYMTGHGGGDFLKFMDDEELNGHDLADSVEAMHKQKRYKEMLIMIDTCQASTLNEHLYSPSVVTIGSSVRDQSSYSHRTDSGVGVSLTDRFTYATYKYFHEHSQAHVERATVKQLFESYDYSFVHSTALWRDDLMPRERAIDKVLLTDFFGSVVDVRLSGRSRFVDGDDGSRGSVCGWGQGDAPPGESAQPRDGGGEEEGARGSDADTGASQAALTSYIRRGRFAGPSAGASKGDAFVYALLASVGALCVLVAKEVVFNEQIYMEKTLSQESTRLNNKLMDSMLRKSLRCNASTTFQCDPSSQGT